MKIFRLPLFFILMILLFHHVTLSKREDLDAMMKKSPLVPALFSYCHEALHSAEFFTFRKTLFTHHEKTELLSFQIMMKGKCNWPQRWNKRSHDKSMNEWMNDTAQNSVFSPNFLVWIFFGKSQFLYFFYESPETMRKLCFFTKFPHQEIRWNYGISCSVND